MMDDGTMASTDEAMALIRAADADPRGTVLMLLRVLGGGLATATRERDEARTRLRSAEAGCDQMRAERDEARAEMERLRRRIGALGHAVMMADSLDGEVSFDDIECPFCDEVWRDNGHALACPRHMGDVIRRERAAGDGAP